MHVIFILKVLSVSTYNYIEIIYKILLRTSNKGMLNVFTENRL